MRAQYVFPVRSAAILVICNSMLLMAQGPSNAGTTLITTTTTRRAKATPDECYKGLGLNGPPPVAKPPCVAPAIPKVNQSYVWALTANLANTNELWFGTSANTNCWTYSGSLADPNSAKPHQTSSYACEFGLSPFSTTYSGPLPPALGDFRPPLIYLYDRSTGALTNKTPVVPSTTPPQLATQGTRGVRAAVATGGLILLGGPHVDPARGINLFGFNAATKTYLGLRNSPLYNNIRSFTAIDGVLYSAVGKTAGGGAIVRVSAAPSSPCPAPPTACFTLTLDEVGTMDTVGAYIAVHNGRLYATTWPTESNPNSPAALWMSPPIPPGGLTNTHVNSWTRVWKVDDYEPDPVIVKSYAGGALASFDGYLYWGTQHEPFLAYEVFTRTYGKPVTQEEQRQAVTGTQRAFSVFRGKDFETTAPTVDLLYGGTRLPVYTPGAPGKWTLTPNKTGKAALYGPGGFGNFFNNYAWTMKVWNNRLWVGTMDWAHLSQQGAQLIADAIGTTLPPNLYSRQVFGADLFYFPSSASAAVQEYAEGVGNYTSYGVRTMLDVGNMFIGMANPINLLTDTTDTLPEGGWELIEMAPVAPNTPEGSNVSVALADEGSVDFCKVSKAGKSHSKYVANPWLNLSGFDPLLSGYDLDGPVTPSGRSTPANVTLLWSSAEWRTGCKNAEPAKVKIKLKDLPANAVDPRLYETQWNGTEYIWADITTKVNGGKIEGVITSRNGGLLAIMSKAQ